jgi:hypothetical protein
MSWKNPGPDELRDASVLTLASVAGPELLDLGTVRMEHDIIL